MQTVGLQPERQPYGGYFPAVPYGGFWRRLLAYLIDGVVLGTVGGALQAAVALIVQGSSAVPQNGGVVPTAASGVWSVIFFVGTWLYFAFMESSPYQATLGKMALGMKVTDVEGNRISFARATGRWFAKILSALILYIGFIMIAFHPRKRGLHDIIAGTLVYKVAALRAGAQALAG
jgi:uncharacterized RDD family membrane protein YckC